MSKRVDSVKVSVGSGALMGGGAVLGPVATGVPYNPALADALAMQSDQLAVAGDLWGSIGATPVAGDLPAHPDQGNLFEQH